MKTTPLDLRSQAFNKKMRGYDPDEVHTFLDAFADELEQHLKEHHLLLEKFGLLESQVAEYRTMENSLRETLMAAQRASEEMRGHARKEADLVLQQAEVESQRMVNETKDQLTQVRKELAELSMLKRNYMLQFRSLLDAHKLMLDDLEKSQAEGTQRTLRLSRKGEVTDEEIEKVVQEFNRSSATRTEREVK